MLGISEAGAHYLGAHYLGQASHDPLAPGLPVSGLQYTPLHLALENSFDEQESWKWPQKAG